MKNEVINMERQEELPKGALDVMLKEYERLKDEIKEPLKIAFSHVAYAGGIVAFALPATKKVSESIPYYIPIVLAGIAVAFLIGVSLLNLRWVQHCGIYLKTLEKRINLHFGTEILGWESYAADIQTKLCYFIPKSPFDKSTKQHEKGEE